MRQNIVNTLEKSMMASDFEVAELPNGKFRCKMRVASAFFAAVIGKKGASKKRIEIETKTRVDIPRQVFMRHDILITDVTD